MINRPYNTKGAQAIEGGNFLALYGNRVDGILVRLKNTSLTELPLGCSPIPWGTGTPDLTGVMCVKQSTKKFEEGGNKVLSTAFLLVRDTTLAPVWRLFDTKGWSSGIPAIASFGSKIWVIAPVEPSSLQIYEIDAASDR